jgi:hypothetical protein
MTERVCECGEKLDFAGERAVCKVCGKRYSLIDNEKVDRDGE